MRLFSSDLFRNFGIGFVLGAVLIVGANAESWSGAVASPAQAAELNANTSGVPAPADEFVIAPFKG
jgi:hypothetical protein